MKISLQLLTGAGLSFFEFNQFEILFFFSLYSAGIETELLRIKASL